MHRFERVLKYINLQPEEAPEFKASEVPRLGWPQHGEVVFDNVFMKYRPHLDPVLKVPILLPREDETPEHVLPSW